MKYALLNLAGILVAKCPVSESLSSQLTIQPPCHFFGPNTLQNPNFLFKVNLAAQYVISLNFHCLGKYELMICPKKFSRFFFCSEKVVFGHRLSCVQPSLTKSKIFGAK